MLIKIVQNGIESDWFQLTKKGPPRTDQKEARSGGYT